MKVICNGFPKTGTHALIRAVELLGEKTEHAHLPYDEKEPGSRHIVIFRNPRNVMVSYLRFFKKEVTEGLLIGLCKEIDGLPFKEAFGRYTDYLFDPDVLTIKYEDLIEDEAVSLQNISNYLSIQMPVDAPGKVVGLTRTLTDRRSDWTEHWSDLVEKAYIEAGGLEVEKLWNY